MIILRLAIVVAAILGMVVSSDTGTFAQGTRVDLDAATAELQKKPGNAALRERAIKIALALVPTPDPPEEARRAFVRGNTALEAAKTPADYDRAIALYEQALRFAPWFADAYFNQSKAYELRQRFPDAIAALRWYILAAPNAADTRAAQDKIYALEEKAEALKRTPPPAGPRPATPIQTKPAVPVHPTVTIEGVWRWDGHIAGFGPVWEITTIRRVGDQYSISGIYVNEQRRYTLVSANDTSITVREDMNPVDGDRFHRICVWRLTNSAQSLEWVCDLWRNDAPAGIKHGPSVYRRVQ